MHLNAGDAAVNCFLKKINTGNANIQLVYFYPAQCNNL